jgi:hypothetical protein
MKEKKLKLDIFRRESSTSCCHLGESIMVLSYKDNLGEQKLLTDM